jgi:Putative serine dehydratase domain
MASNVLEHGRLGISGATYRLGLGDKIRLVPGHCDPTVNLYDWYVAIRANRVEQLWPITARGAVYRRSSLVIPDVGPLWRLSCGGTSFCSLAPSPGPLECPSGVGGARRGDGRRP